MKTYNLDHLSDKARKKLSQLQGGCLRNSRNLDVGKEMFLEGQIVEVILSDDFIEVKCKDLKAIDNISGIWHPLAEHSLYRTRSEFTRSHFDSDGKFAFYKIGEILELFPPSSASMYSELTITDGLISQYIGGKFRFLHGVGLEESVLEGILVKTAVKHGELILTYRWQPRLKRIGDESFGERISELRKDTSDLPFPEIRPDKTLVISGWDETLVLKQPITNEIG